MKIMILGASGMLGQALVAEAWTHGHDVITERVELTDKDALIAHLNYHEPDVIINAAALVDLNACEADSAWAYDINTRPVRWLTEYCLDQNDSPKLVQISSDQCAVTPIPNIYAASKRQAEHLAKLVPNALIVRTNIVGPKNTDWIFDAIAHDKPVTLFEDYCTASIDVWSFSKTLLDVLEQDPDCTGVLNIASRDLVSKKAFIEALATRLGKPLTHATVGSVKDITPKRHERLALDVSDVETMLNRQMPVLEDVINSLAERRNLCINPLPSTDGSSTKTAQRILSPTWPATMTGS